MVHHRGRVEALVFYLADAVKALAQFEQATEIEEAFLVHCLHLHANCFVVAFGYARAATLPSNMVDVGLRQMVSSVAGNVTSLCVIPSRNL